MQKNTPHVLVVDDEMRTHGKPCILLCDLMLPDMAGGDLVDMMRADPVLADTPIVMVTGMPAASPPGVPVLSKPLEWTKLRSIVERHCHRGPRAAAR